MNNLVIKPTYFYILILTFFFTDIIFNGYFEKQILQSLFCFIILCSIKKPSMFASVFALTLLSLEAFLFYGRFGFDLGITIPLILIARTLDKTFTMPYLIGGGLIISYIIIKSTLLEKFILGLNVPISYTFLLISVNLMFSIILKFLIQGRLGNRFITIKW